MHSCIAEMLHHLHVGQEGEGRGVPTYLSVCRHWCRKQHCHVDVAAKYHSLCVSLGIIT